MANKSISSKKYVVFFVKVQNECGSVIITNSFQENCHTEWVSCVRFSPNAQNPAIVSCGWDKVVKVLINYYTSLA